MTMDDEWFTKEHDELARQLRRMKGSIEG